MQMWNRDDSNRPAMPGWRRAARLWAGVLLVAAALPLHGWAAQVSATLNRDTISLGESATLSLNYEEVRPKTAPVPPAVTDVNVAYLGHQEQQSIVNGKSTRRLTLNYNLTPVRVGQFTIPSLRVEADGRTFTTTPLQLTVLKPMELPEGVAPGEAFLRLSIPKNEVYLGEALPVEIQIFAQAAQLVQVPQFNEADFTFGPVVGPAEHSTVIGNQRYNMVTFRTYVKAVRPGTLQLGPVTMPLRVPQPRARRSIFGEILDWQTISLTSAAETLRVRPLPAQNMPPGFSGAVGQYTLGFSAGPTDVAVGDPITVKVQIAGRGPLETVTLPEQPQWNRFKRYEISSLVETNDQLALSGVKTFEQALIPQSDAIRELPPFQFSFFDPETGAYRTLEHPAIPLTVRPGGIAAQLPPPTANERDESQPTARSEIVHIKPRLHGTGETGAWVERPWFVALQGVPVLAWVALLATRLRREAIDANPRLRRRREAAARVRSGLQELHRHAGAQQGDAFYATLFRVLQEQIGARLDQPASAITESVVEERLRGTGLPEPVLDDLRDLFQACNQARFAPAADSRELASMIPRVESVLNTLESTAT